MIKFFDRNIELIIKLLIFFSAIMVVTPITFINGSLYFWFVVLIVIIFNLTVMIKDIKTYFNKFKFEMLFVICCLFSSLINYGKYNNIYSIVYIIYTAYLIFGMLPVRDKDNKTVIRDNKIIEYTVVGYTFIVTLFSFIDLLLFKNNEIVNIITVDRFSGIYLNPNQAAFWGFVSIAFSRKSLEVNKRFKIVNIVIQLLLIIFSGCRSVYIALIGFILMLFFEKNKGENIKKLSFVFLGLIISFVIGISILRYSWLFKYFSFEAMEEIFNILTGLRYFIWKEIGIVFLRSPFFGVGVNNIRFAAAEYLDSGSFLFQGAWEDAHNFIITLLSYTGIFGFSAFSMLMYKYFKLGKLSYNKIDLMIVISILIICMFDIGVIFDDRIISVVFWYEIGNLIYNFINGGVSHDKNKIL